VAVPAWWWAVERWEPERLYNLLRAGATVVMASPQATQELEGLAASGELRWIREPFRNDHLHGVFLAVAATDDDALNAQVVPGGPQGNGGPWSAMLPPPSAPRSSSGHSTSGDGFTVAVFTDGRNPSRAREIRDRIASGPPAQRRIGPCSYSWPHGSRDPVWRGSLEDLDPVGGGILGGGSGPPGLHAVHGAHPPGDRRGMGLGIGAHGVPDPPPLHGQRRPRRQGRQSPWWRSSGR
jgi:hypothetical protein